jgi:hypothetical protein
MNSPKTQDEHIIHALNIHGTFFERKCIDLISQTEKWEVITSNFPVEYPPPNGPMRGKESSLDIWARKSLNLDAYVDILVECKKANPEFVNWVFFPKGETSSLNNFRLFSIQEEMDKERKTINGMLQPGSTRLTITTEAREVRGDYKRHISGNLTKTSNAAINDASYQVTLASMAIQSKELKIMKSIFNPSPWKRKTYVPMIVTTANLFTINYSPENIDEGNGEISLDKASLVEVDQLIYEYPTPVHLQHTPLKSNHFDINRMDDFSRTHIIIVNSKKLVKFLNENLD